MRPSRIILLIVVLGAGGCGRVADLQPAAGKPLPVKPLMARSTPTPNELLAIPTDFKPSRVDELVTRSQVRPVDPFDLPPPTGGAAPSQPAGTDPQPVTNETGPATPKQ
jgi:hypothetical protein